MSNDEITLGSGHQVRVVRLDQRPIYAGVLEGAPNSPINRGMIEEAVRGYASMAPMAKCHLLEPVERPYPDRAKIVLLPPIVCGALLERRGSTFEGWPCWEHSIVVWFQDEYAMPIASKILSAIQSLDWPFWRGRLRCKPPTALDVRSLGLVRWTNRSMILYRPVGVAELRLTVQSGLASFLRGCPSSRSSTKRPNDIQSKLLGATHTKSFGYPQRRCQHSTQSWSEPLASSKRSPGRSSWALSML